MPNKTPYSNKRDIWAFTCISSLSLFIIFAIIRISGLYPYTESLFSNVTPPLYVLKGFFSDLFCALLLGLIGNLFHPIKSHHLFYITLIFLAVSNQEHINFNHSNALVSQSRYLFDINFIMGSLLSFPIITQTILYSILFLSVFYFINSDRDKRANIFRNTYLSFVFISGAFTFLPSNPLINNWAQENFIIENSIFLAQKHMFETEEGFQINAYAVNAHTPHAEHLPENETIEASPLIINAPSTKTNIVFLIVEGLSYKHLFKGYTPFLDNLAQNNILYDNFVNLQRVTTNGLYSLWCGDTPNMLNLGVKPEVLLAQNSFPTCLPEH